MSRASRHIDSIVSSMPMTADERVFLTDIKHQLRALNTWDREQRKAKSAKKRARRRNVRHSIGAEIREMTENLHEELYRLRMGCYPQDEPEYDYEDFTYIDDAGEGMPSPECTCSYCRSYFADGHATWSEYDDHLYDYDWEY